MKVDDPMVPCKFHCGGSHRASEQESPYYDTALKLVNAYYRPTLPWLHEYIDGIAEALSRAAHEARVETWEKAAAFVRLHRGEASGIAQQFDWHAARAKETST